MKSIFTFLFLLCLTSCSPKFSSSIRIDFEPSIDEQVARKVVAAVIKDTNTKERKFSVKPVSQKWRNWCLNDQSIHPLSYCSANFRVSGVYYYGQTNWGLAESCKAVNICEYVVISEISFEE